MCATPRYTPMNVHVEHRSTCSITSHGWSVSDTKE